MYLSTPLAPRQRRRLFKIVGRDQAMPCHPGPLRGDGGAGILFLIFIKVGVNCRLYGLLQQALRPVCLVPIRHARLDRVGCVRE